MIMVDFDPYASWLNIQDPQRPLTPYQLLALGSLELDVGKIRAAFERQEAALSRITDPVDAEILDNVRKEVEDAYLLLLDPQRKAVLDASIRRHSGAAREVTFASVSTGANSTVTCGGCQAANASTRRFCSGCGQSLWQKCPNCGAECSAVDKFCGTCGVEVQASLTQQEKACQLRLDEALALVAAHHYDSALRELRGVAAVDNPRLEGLAARALVEIERTEQKRQEAGAVANTALEHARQLFSTYSYERALQALEEVPKPLRSEEHVRLLERANAARLEVLGLSGEIRQAVEEKRIYDLAPKLERLLALKPSLTQGRQLAEQVREHHVAIAKARLKQFKYQEALDYIQQVPKVVSNEMVETLQDTASELARLISEVRDGALADRSLLALADRLCKLAPNDPVAAKLREQLIQRMKTSPADPRFGAPNQAPVRKKTLLGPPVDWLAHFQRATPENEEVGKILRAHPGQFFVAFGLALQGIGMVNIDADLTPRPARLGRLVGLSTLGLGRRTASAAWGLDLSERSLKAIQLVATGRGEVRIKAAEFFTIDAVGLGAEAGEQSQNIQGVLSAFVAKVGNVKGTKVCVALPEHRVLGRFFELPAMPAKKVADSVQFEVKHQMPVPLEELCWSYALLDGASGRSGDNQSYPLMVQAARESHVRDRIGCFKEAGIAVDSVQSNSVALHNSLAFEFAQSDEYRAGSFAAVDVGAACTNIVVSSPRCVWFRTFNHGGEVFARELVRQLQLTSDQASTILREPSRAKRFSRWLDALQPLYLQFGSEISRSLAIYQKLWPDNPVRHIFGLGGAFPVVGLLRHLRSG